MKSIFDYPLKATQNVAVFAFSVFLLFLGLFFSLILCNREIPAIDNQPYAVTLLKVKKE